MEQMARNILKETLRKFAAEFTGRRAGHSFPARQANRAQEEMQGSTDPRVQQSLDRSSRLR